MATEEKKGITVKIDAELHAQVREYIEANNMTMAEFVTRALDDELHPKNDMKEGITMANTRTIAFQVPEELFQRIKDYLQRNHLTQRQFLIGLIEDELERDQVEYESQDEDQRLDEDNLEETDAKVGESEEGESEEVGMAMSM